MLHAPADACMARDMHMLTAFGSRTTQSFRIPDNDELFNRQCNQLEIKLLLFFIGVCSVHYDLLS